MKIDFSKFVLTSRFKYNEGNEIIYCYVYQKDEFVFRKHVDCQGKTVKWEFYLDTLPLGFRICDSSPENAFRSYFLNVDSLKESIDSGNKKIDDVVCQ